MTPRNALADFDFNTGDRVDANTALLEAPADAVFRREDGLPASMRVNRPVDIHCREWRDFSPYFAQVLGTSAPLALVDVLSIGIALAISLLAAKALGLSFLFSGYANNFLGAMAAMLLTQLLSSGYPGTGLHPVMELKSMVFVVTSVWFSLAMANLLFTELLVVEAGVLVFAWLVSVVLCPMARHCARHFLARFEWWGEKAVIVGGGEVGDEVFHRLRRMKALGLRPVGIVAEPHIYWRSDNAPRETPYLGTFAEIVDIARRHHIFWAVDVNRLGHAKNKNTHRPGGASSSMDTLARRLSGIPHWIYLADELAFPGLISQASDIGGSPGICVSDRLLLPWPRFLKRMLDLAIILIASPLLVPLLCGIALGVKLFSTGPIFFVQERPGRGGRTFRMWKFRSMVVDAERKLAAYLDQHPELRDEWKRDSKIKHDPRIIPGIGSFIRCTSLDELPQIWNVLRGEMSLVGPRPMLCKDVERYEEVYSLYSMATPGITGLWQISGRNNTTFEERRYFDAYYVKNWSPWLDIYILARTIKTVLFREGAY